jgi:hypothetical protein
LVVGAVEDQEYVCGQVISISVELCSPREIKSKYRVEGMYKFLIFVLLCPNLLLSCRENAKPAVFLNQDSCVIYATGLHKIKSIRIQEDRIFSEPSPLDTTFKTAVKEYRLCMYYDYKNKMHSPLINGILVDVGMEMDSNFIYNELIDIQKEDSAKKIINGYLPGK